jgi:glycosyltransferase involved in cell wall biosynthesis
MPLATTVGRPVIRIMEVFPTLGQPYGWAQGVAEGLSNGLAQLGHEVEIVTTAEHPKQERWQSAVTLRSFPIDLWTRRSPRLLRNAYVSTALTRHVRWAVDDFDLIHVHTLYSFVSAAAARAAHRAHVPSVISPCGSLDPYTHARKGRVRKDVFQALYHRRDLARAAAVHFLSERELELASGFEIAAPQVVVELGLAAEKYSLQRSGAFTRWHPELAGSRVIMYLGRISYTKGLDLLVRAFAQIAQRFGDAHLVLAGPDYEGFGGVLAEMLRACGLTNRVTFSGLLSEADKVAALADADVLVLSSYTEAFGIALLEGMASGLPVVVTDRAALAPVIRDAGAGLVVQADDKALAEALRLLLADADLRRVLGRRGRRLVETRFSWGESARAFARLYEALANKRVLEPRSAS